MKLFFASLIIASGLSSCTTTGDPSQGGLFGWSESKADVRIQERLETLQDIEAERRWQRATTRSLRDEKVRLSRLENPKPKAAGGLQDVPDPDALSASRKF